MVQKEVMCQIYAGKPWVTVHVQLDEGSAKVEPAVASIEVGEKRYKFTKVLDSSIADEPQQEAIDYIFKLVEPLCQATFARQKTSVQKTAVVKKKKKFTQT